MTDEVKPEESSEETQVPEIDVQALASQVEKLTATNQRLLDESVQYKKKYNGLKTEVESRRKESLEEEENWRELYESEKKRVFELQDENHQVRKTALKKDMHFKVASMATDAYDVNDIISALPRDRMAVDDENGQVSGVDDALAWVRQNKPHLFKQNKSTGMSDQRPAGSSGKRSWNEFTNEEKDAAFKDALGEWL